MIRVDLKGIKEVRRRLRRVQRSYPDVAAKALNTARRAARREFLDAVAGPGGETTMAPQRAARLVRARKGATRGSLKNVISVSGQRVGAQHFDLRLRAAGGIVVRFRRDDEPAVYPQAFFWRGNWFQRRRWSSNLPAVTGRGNRVTRAPSGLVGRLPVFRIEGPRVTSLLANVEEVRARTANVGLRVLKAQLRKGLRP